jgi:hypothetical protein
VGGEEFGGLRVPENGLAGAETGAFGEGMALFGEGFEGFGAEGFFDLEFGGRPLVVESGGGEGFGGFHAVVDDVGDGEEGLGDDGGAAGGADGEDGAAVVENEGGAHAGEGAFAWGDGVGFGADEFEGVGDAGLDGEVVHFVVEEDAGAWDDDFAAEGGVDGLGEATQLPSVSAVLR